MYNIIFLVQGENMTALMYAVKHGYTSIIRTFVLNKADLLIQDAVS